MKTLSLDELYEKSQNLSDGEVLLDVRTEEEFAQGHIKGSLNIPHDQVEDHLEKLKEYSQIYIYCKMGGRAVRAFYALEDLGEEKLNVVSQGGMHAWMEMGRPTES